VAATVMVATAASRASGQSASAGSSSLDTIHDGVGHPRGLPTTESPTPEPTTWMPSPMPSIPPTPTPEPSAPVAHREWGDAASGDGQNMNDVSVASIEWTCGGDKMALACKVEATFDGLVDTDTRSWESTDTTWMTVQYEPLYPHSALPAMWASPTEVDTSTGKISLDVLRLRPRTEYMYTIYMQQSTNMDDGNHFVESSANLTYADNATAVSKPEPACGNATAVHNGTFFVGETYVPAFDVKHGKIGHHIGGSKPTWDVAGFVYSTDKGGSEHGSAKDAWSGIVMVDAEGFVIWYCQNVESLNSRMLQIGPFDQMASSYDIAYGIWFSSGAGGFPYPDQDDDEYDETLTGVLVQVDVFGRTKYKLDMQCSGITNLNAVTMHEMRALSPTELMITGFAMHAEQNFTINGGALENNLVASGTLNIWTPEEGVVSQIVDTWVGLNPKLTGINTCPYCDNVLAECGTQQVAVLDYMHISSAAPGSDGNYLVSLRNLNMVASINASQMDQVQWILSSNPQTNAPSIGTFAFEKEEDKFYLPHHVSQLSSDRILLMDDGTDRPDGQNYSRAVEYEFDSDSMTAKIVWQFEWPLNMSAHMTSKHTYVDIEKKDLESGIGNSVTRMPNGHYLVGYTDVLTAVDDDNSGSGGLRTDMIMFDVGNSGKMHSALKFQGISLWGEGSYRAIPFPSVYGESTSCPLS